MRGHWAKRKLKHAKAPRVREMNQLRKARGGSYNIAWLGSAVETDFIPGFTG